MNLAQLAAMRGDAGRPVRAGLIGAGKFGSMFLSQVPGIAGLEVAAIADLDPARARAACQTVGWDAARIEATAYLEDGAALCARDDVEVVIEATGNPRAGIAHARSHGHTAVIIDTAGRLAIDEQMMDEIARIKQAVKPQETLFVVDAMTGQDAVNTAKAFNDRLDIDGVVLTKLDGDARGGAALSIRSVVDKPIKFIGTGEKLEALDEFHPDRMAGRILGMGDVVSLVERAQEQFDEEQARKLQKKIAKDQFGFDDFLEQVQQIKKMGNMKDLLGMVPGMGKAIKGLDIPDDAFKGIEAMINSMTPEERRDPELINGSRRQRIASGSGTTVTEVNKLLKQFGETRKMMKLMGDKKKMANMMRQMQAMQGMKR